MPGVEAPLIGRDRAPGVVSSLAITLAIQALAAMASVTIPVLAPVASVDTGIPLNAIGIFMAIFYFGGMVSSLASGDFILRYGPIRVSQVCLLLCGIGLTAAAVGSLPLMILGALLVGIGYGPVTPASSHLLAKTAPPHLMSLTFSIKQTGVPIGGAMAGALVPPLVLCMGWRWTSIAVGGACILLAALAGSSRGSLDTDLQRDRRLSFTGITDPLKLIYSLPAIRELVVTSFVFASMQVCLSTYFVSFLTVDLNVPLVQAGLTLTVALTAGIVGRIAWGGVADRLVAPRKMLGILGIVMSTSAAATFCFTRSWPYAAVLGVSALFGASAVGWNGVYLAEVVRLAPPGKAGMATGGTLFFTFFGCVIAPPLFAVLAGVGHRYSFAYLVFAVPIFLLGVRMVWGKRRV